MQPRTAGFFVCLVALNLFAADPIASNYRLIPIALPAQMGRLRWIILLTIRPAEKFGRRRAIWAVSMSSTRKPTQFRKSADSKPAKSSVVDEK
jgi:hypothetical protein